MLEEYKKKLHAYMFAMLDGIQTKEQEDELMVIRNGLSSEEKETLNVKGALNLSHEDIDSWLKRKR